MEARPDAGVDDLLEGLREPVEVPRLTVEAAACHIEPDLVGAEEHLQHLKVRTVQTEVPGRVLGVGRGEERRPRRVRLGRGIAVPVRLVDRLPRSPEVPVVLVVPAADRRVRAAQVQLRKQEGAVDDVDAVAGRC